MCPQKQIYLLEENFYGGPPTMEEAFLITDRRHQSVLLILIAYCLPSPDYRPNCRMKLE